VGTQAGRAAPAQWNRGRGNWRTRDAGAAGIRLVMAGRSVVDTIESPGHYLLWSAGPEHRPGLGNPRRMRTAYLHHRTDRSRLRTALRTNPAQEPDGSPGYSGRSYMAWICRRHAVAQNKPFGSSIFRSTRHPVFARVVRGLPGIYGADASGKDSPNGTSGFGAGRSGTGLGWGKMTDYTAQVAARQVFETQARGRTSKIKRRVERNPA
jgi:hypothetical protein